MGRERELTIDEMNLADRRAGARDVRAILRTLSCGRFTVDEFCLLTGLGAYMHHELSDGEIDEIFEIGKREGVR